VRVWGRVPLDPEEIGAALRDRREEQGVTRDELARYLAMNARTVEQAESRGLAYIAVISRYFEALGLQVRLELAERYDPEVDG
jgi:transcriptional regulator with XRE-family HTH domain